MKLTIVMTSGDAGTLYIDGYGGFPISGFAFKGSVKRDEPTLWIANGAEMQIDGSDVETAVMMISQTNAIQ